MCIYVMTSVVKPDAAYTFRQQQPIAEQWAAAGLRELSGATLKRGARARVPIQVPLGKIYPSLVNLA